MSYCTPRYQRSELGIISVDSGGDLLMSTRQTPHALDLLDSYGRSASDTVHTGRDRSVTDRSKRLISAAAKTRVPT